MAKTQALFLTPANIPEATLDYFRSTLWCTGILADPAYIAVDSIAEDPDSHIGETLLRETLNSERGIRASLSLYRAPSAPADTDRNVDTGEIITLYSLGSGLDGQLKTCHGGVLAVLLDDVAGLILRHDPSVTKHGTYTVSLKIDYRRPVPTPRIVLCRASLVKIEGRKAWVDATVEDGNGVVYATGQTLFLKSKASL